MNGSWFGCWFRRPRHTRLTWRHIKAEIWLDSPRPQPHHGAESHEFKCQATHRHRKPCLKVPRVGMATTVKRFWNLELHNDALWIQPHVALSCPFQSRKEQRFPARCAPVDYREDYTTLQKHHLCKFKTLKAFVEIKWAARRRANTDYYFSPLPVM